MTSTVTDVTGIYFKRGYRYQLVRDYTVQTGVVTDSTRAAASDYAVLGITGVLTIRAGYAWDGPSGPAFDTPNFMRGSLVHDALYQLIRLGLVDERYRVDADRELRKICVEDGMSRLRAAWVYAGVRAFGRGSAAPGSEQAVLSAP